MVGEIRAPDRSGGSTMVAKGEEARRVVEPNGGLIWTSLTAIRGQSHARQRAETEACGADRESGALERIQLTIRE